MTPGPARAEFKHELPYAYDGKHRWEIGLTDKARV